MKEQGTVITRDADTATVRIEKSEACSKCCSCENARARIITVTVDKAAGVNVGDIVEIEVSPSTMLKTYCFIYLFPLMLFAAGSLSVYAFLKDPLKSFAAGCACAMIYYVIIGRYIKKKKCFDGKVSINKVPGE